MANEVLLKSNTPIVIADSTDYAGDLGTRTNQIDLTSLSAGAARQSDKVDLGATRAAVYAVTVALEFASAPTSQEIVEIRWAPSPNSGAGVANPGGVSGSDGGYTGSSGDSLDDSILQLDLIGAFVATADASTTVQFQTFLYSPPHRYGTVVIYNRTSQALVSDAVEMGIALTPLVDEIQ